MHDNERKKIRLFIDGLSEAEVRGELMLAYECMEQCVQVLTGKNGIKPVEMKDNGISSDLELFYTCKNAAEQMYGVEPNKDEFYDE